MAPLAQYVLSAPPFVDQDGFQADPKDLVTNRHHRDKMGLLVDNHQQEFPSSAEGVRALHYVRVQHCFKGVNVPFGSIVELPVVHCYFRDVLRANDLFTWNVFKSESSVAAEVFLLNDVVCGAKAWLYSRTLHSDRPELEWQLPLLSTLALQKLIDRSVGHFESARVGPVVAASLHTLMNVRSRLAKWTRAQATLDTPDYKAFLDIVDRNGLRTDLAHELGEATKMAQNEWRGEAAGSRVRGRDDMLPKEDPRAETRGR
eukprot:contig_6522_g1488